MLNNPIYRNKTMKSQNALQPKQTEAQFWKAMENEKVLDMATINSLKDIGGDELIESLFEIFIIDCEKMTAELAEAEARKDMKQVDQILHTLKGSSGSIGANKLYVLSKYLNEGSRHDRWPENESWIDIFKAATEETVKEMQNHARK